MKKGKNIIILLVVLAALVGGYVYLSKHSKKTTTTTPAAKTISIMKLDVNKINEISIEYNKATINLVKNGSAWQMKDAPGIQLFQSAVNDIVSDFTSLNAERVVVSNSSDLQSYGLSKPVATATATLADGSKKVILLGNTSPSGSDYYLMAKDDPNVYLVAQGSGSCLTVTVSQLRDKTLATVDTTKLNYFKVVNKDGRVVEMKPNSNQTDKEKQANVGTLVLTQPFDKTYDIDLSKLQTYVEGLPSFQISDIIEDNAKDLSKYGLDKPRYDVLFTDTDNKKMHLQIGNDKDSTYTYFKVDGSNTVYIMPKDKIDSIYPDPVKLISAFVYLVNIDEVDKMVINNAGKESTIDLSRTTKKAAKSGDKDTVTTTYKIDGKDVQEKAFKSFYEELVGLSFEQEINKQIPENPEITTTFTLNTGTDKVHKVEYCPYDDNFYGAFVDGKCQFIIPKDRVKQMISDFQNLTASK
ncbi:MAG: DUF4340 domain-containing protein [Bacillota bacterium]|nr:DUF4340 domain-containing protein [Bacillota bacterium]